MITIIQNQSLLDVAIQEAGSVFCVLDIALANQKSITEELIPGQKLNMVESVNKNKQVLTYLKGKSRMIATAFIEIIVEENYEFPQGEFPISL